jgi:hypothetical protein
MRVVLVCTLLAAALAAACGSEGTNDPGDTEADKDARVGPETVVFPDTGMDPDEGNPDVTWETAGEMPDGALADGTDAFDFGAGDSTAQCENDSDCEGKVGDLAPCSRPVCDKHAMLCMPGPRAVGEACDDQNACTQNTSCTVDGRCVGLTVFCDDGNLCTTDTCDPEDGCIYQANQNTCDDGNGCTVSDFCSNGKCAGTETDDCACVTDDDCDDEEDGNKCNGILQCVFGKCKVPQASLVFCDTSGDTPCRKTLCDPDKGKCVQVASANGRPCDDGDACTVNDLCLNGTCVGSAPRSCDDGNPCTVDTCEPALGCSNAFSGYPCEDGDPCTINDHCKDGACVPGASNACTAETCFPKWSLSCGTYDIWSTGMEGASDNIDSYPCGDVAAPGPEYTYAFVAPYDGAATVSLTGDPLSQLVAVLEARDVGCDAVNCRGVSPAAVAFDIAAGQTYYLVVDGTGGGLGYHIALTCVPGVESQCADGVDDDGDTLVDCDDPDCKGTAACPDPVCVPIWTLSCGSTDFGANYGLGSTDAVVSYASPALNKGCLDNPWEYEGREFAYRFDAPGNFDVSVKLTGETSQTDLLVLQDSGHGCDPLDCVAWGLKKVTFPAEAGATYYFVVDGYAGALGAFDITVECPLFVETDCSDLEDNDLDTKTDCEDEDCVGSPWCVGHCKPQQSVSCGFKQAFANFGWGSTDAVTKYQCKQAYVYPGPEMAYRFKAPYDAAVKATLALESDSTDIAVLEGEECDPEKCLSMGLDNVVFNAKKDSVYSIVVDGWQGALGTYVLSLDCTPATEVECADGVDNDADGLLDCADAADCSQSPLCAKCSATYPIQCGETDDWSTKGEGATDVVPVYGCTGSTYDGPEFAYTFAAESDSTVTFTLSAAGHDLDLFVLADDGLGCNPAVCVAWGTTAVTFDAKKGSSYFVVVDGYGKTPADAGDQFGASDFSLTATCQ